MICRNVRFDMERYVALLRGVNISGKNKISMPELRSALEQLGYADVRTYLNSGNAAFSAGEDDETNLAAAIRDSIANRLALDIPVFVIPQKRLVDILNSAPDWWGSPDKDIYDNLIFVMPPASAEDVAGKIGEPTKELEQICIRDNSIFWSFDRNGYAKANWWKKTASAGIAELLTIRTANTLRKIAAM